MDVVGVSEEVCVCCAYEAAGSPGQGEDVSLVFRGVHYHRVADPDLVPHHHEVYALGQPEFLLAVWVVHLADAVNPGASDVDQDLSSHLELSARYVVSDLQPHSLSVLLDYLQGFHVVCGDGSVPEGGCHR